MGITITPFKFLCFSSRKKLISPQSILHTRDTRVVGPQRRGWETCEYFSVISAGVVGGGGGGGEGWGWGAVLVSQC